MLTINFYPESDLDDVVDAAKEYDIIWKQDGEKIVSVWEKTTRLRFQETFINAIVYMNISHSHPLSLRSNLDTERKKTVLVHELGHRILFKKIKDGRESTSLETHKVLFLLLYEILSELYGKNVAQRAIEWDINLPRTIYKEAWEWALNFSPDERRKKFFEILEKGYGYFK